MSGSTSLMACEKATYSLSVAERVISDCNFDAQMIRHFENMTIYPVGENTDDGSSPQLAIHFPAKDASTKVSTLYDALGLNTIPWFSVR